MITSNTNPVGKNVEELTGIIQILRQELRRLYETTEAQKREIDFLLTEYKKLSDKSQSYYHMKGEYKALVDEIKAWEDGQKDIVLEQNEKIQKAKEDVEMLNEAVCRLSTIHIPKDEAAIAAMKLEDIHTVGDVTRVLQNVMGIAELTQEKLDAVYQANKKAGRVSIQK